MAVTLRLKPEVEADLVARARASGMDLEEYLLSLVEAAVISPPQEASGTSQNGRKQAVRRMLEFGEKHHLDFGEPITRELLHERHRY